MRQRRFQWLKQLCRYLVIVGQCAPETLKVEILAQIAKTK